MWFEVQRISYFKQHFDIEEIILQQPREQIPYFYSSTATKYN